eukprot:7391833-Prymnesium_polylepis.1
MADREASRSPELAKMSRELDLRGTLRRSDGRNPSLMLRLGVLEQGLNRLLVRVEVPKDHEMVSEQTVIVPSGQSLAHSQPHHALQCDHQPQTRSDQIANDALSDLAKHQSHHSARGCGPRLRLLAVTLPQVSVERLHPSKGGEVLPASPLHHRARNAPDGVQRQGALARDRQPPQEHLKDLGIIARHDSSR